MNKTGSLVRFYVVLLKDNIKQLHNLFKSSLMCLNHVQGLQEYQENIKWKI